MAHIAIAPAGNRCYDVTVDGGSRHRVSVLARFGDEDVERVVRVSFEFLLEREPAGDPAGVLAGRDRALLSGVRGRAAAPAGLTAQAARCRGKHRRRVYMRR